MSDFLRAVEEELPGTLRRTDDGVSLVPASVSAAAEVISIACRMGAQLSVPGAAHDDGRPILRLDQLDAVVGVDEESRALHVEAGARLADVETRAGDLGWTLGVAEGFGQEQVGAWLARGAPGRFDKEDDPVLQLVAGMNLALPDGRVVSMRAAPRRAVGPDLVGAVIGARGRLGAILSVHLVAQARRASSSIAFEFADESTAASALQRVRGAGIRPTRVRLDGPVLRLVLEIEGARASAALSVTQRIAGELGGRAVHEDGTAVGPSSPVAESDTVLRCLARELDPTGVLQP